MTVSGELHAPAALLEKKDPSTLGTHYIGGWISPRGSLGASEDNTYLTVAGNRINNTSKVTHFYRSGMRHRVV